MSDHPTKILSPGELAVGQLITILEWLPRETSPDPFGGLFGSALVATQSRDRSWCGDVLKVEAVDLPYIVVKESYDNARPFKIDTREARLMECSKAYIDALKKS